VENRTGWVHAFYTELVRLGVYADLLYRRDEGGVSTSTAFVLWLNGLGEQVDELILFGRTHPEAGRAQYRLADAGIRFVSLPYYESLRHVGAVAAATARSAAIWNRELSRCDAVLIFGPHPYAALFGLQAHFAHVPTVVGVRQDLPVYLSYRFNGLKRRAAVAAGRSLELISRRLAREGGAVAVGEEMARRYAARSGRVLATGVSLVRAADLVAVEEAVARPWPGGHQVLVAGRLDPEKNPMLLLETAKALRQTGPWQLVVAGTGSMAAELASQVRSQGLEDSLLLVGRLDRERLFELHRQSTVLLHVSLTEGQPQVFYEAAAAGLPIVATAVGGVPAALAHGRRGALVPPSDVAAIVTAIYELGSEPTRRIAMIRAASEWAANETLDVQVGRVAAFISEVASATSQPRRLSARRRR